MSALSKILLAIGLLQIIHSGYSIHQFNSISKLVNTSSISSQIYLPLDVKVEVYCGLVVTIVSILLSFDKVKYMKLSENRIVRTNERLLPIKTNVTNGHEALIINGNDNSLALQRDYETSHFIDFQKNKK